MRALRALIFLFALWTDAASAREVDITTPCIVDLYGHSLVCSGEMPVPLKWVLFASDVQMDKAGLPVNCSRKGTYVLMFRLGTDNKSYFCWRR